MNKKLGFTEGGVNLYIRRTMANGKTWILVADHSRAQLYENLGPGKQLQKVREIASPPSGSPRHTDSHDGQDRKTSGEEFAGHLCEVLQAGRVKRNFDRLILVATPKFLGQIRSKLDKATTATVTATLDKDFMRFSDTEIQQHLNDKFFTF